MGWLWFGLATVSKVLKVSNELCKLKLLDSSGYFKVAMEIKI